MTQVQPTALCNENCHPGSRKNKKEGRPFCCFDCVPCANGKFSDRKDMDDCITCPEGQYPNKKQDQCNLKTLNFLSFSEPLGIISTVLSLFFSLVTAIVLVIFTKNKSTPIVKANNVDLSFTLLVSLFFCFLCSLLFIGVPHTVSCYLQQIGFVVTFTVAISCILAKTIIVVVAFMATKPGSRMKNWVRKRLANSILLGCSSIQVIICTLWLLIFPPFPDVDMHSLSKEIILECNEGSVIMFYCGLSYLGFLALASLFMAFVARKLPATFNEAKLITFGMLVFCSVLLCFLSAYSSIKGKHFAIVEIFSILAVSVGFLVCIFFPKCYILIMRSELNCKGQLVRKISKTPRLKSCAHLSG
ncbi:vomeronasal type-2 receptor 26-like [Anolis carolinensis]|uniref:vomeronasal type-2 receptor 26-like n=1 Tax=Anolis carolinensis TaxID=28377 RepID=UPI002F2B1EAF